MGIGRKARREAVPIDPDAKVADVVEAWPEALDVLLEMGFAPLRNPIARKTIGRVFSLRQAAAFRGVDLAEMLRRLRAATGQAPSAEAPKGTPQSGPTPEPAPPLANPDAVPELEGDVRILGLVPCPVRGPLTERFDAFARDLGSRSGKSVAWWLAGEGVAAPEVRRWLADVAATGETHRLPDVFLSVGTELFFHETFGRFGSNGAFQRFPVACDARPELAGLEDPHGVLGVPFAVLFTWACRPDRLPGGRLPRRWSDLAAPAFRGEVGLPTLKLPIVPDLLAALHGHLGDEGFAGLAANLASTMHPAQAAPRARRGDVPGVVVLPLLFGDMSAATGGVSVVPEDGAIAVSAYVAVRDGAPPEAHEVAAFLCSETFLRPLWDNGKFLPNCRAIDAPIPGGKVITRDWGVLHSGDAEDYTRRLMALVGGEDAE